MVSSEIRLKDALLKVGELKVRNAFAKSTFVYGTQGKGSTVVKALRLFNTRRGNGIDPKTEDLIGRKLNLFEPGKRVGAYIGGGHQMMDMYYGQAGNNLHDFRDPVIAEYVHFALGYKSEFSMKQSGRDTYMEHFRTKEVQAPPLKAGFNKVPLPKVKVTNPEEGWKATDRTDYGVDSIGKNMTATKEISRIIRAGIRTFGGTLIFEGRDVFYSQVFDSAAPYIGDTDLEAQELFRYFTPNSATAQFGRGKIIFHWNGKETVPTKYHFMSNWKFAADDNKNMLLHNKANVGGLTFEGGPSFRPIWKNFSDVPTFLAGVDRAKLLQFMQNHGSRL